jgi:hypothetical protein
MGTVLVLYHTVLVLLLILLAYPRAVRANYQPHKAQQYIVQYESKLTHLLFLVSPNSLCLYCTYDTYSTTYSL